MVNLKHRERVALLLVRQALPQEHPVLRREVEARQERLQCLRWVYGMGLLLAYIRLDTGRTSFWVYRMPSRRSIVFGLWYRNLSIQALANPKLQMGILHNVSVTE